MAKIKIYNPKDYPIKKNQIEQIVNETLKTQKIKEQVEVNVSFVDDREMTFLHEKYLKEKGTTDVLSFPLEELKSKKSSKLKFKNPGSRIQLGDMVICYPECKRQAKNHGATIEEEISKLLEHGLLHLLGKHHE